MQAEIRIASAKIIFYLLFEKTEWFGFSKSIFGF